MFFCETLDRENHALRGVVTVGNRGGARTRDRVHNGRALRCVALAKRSGAFDALL